jgi:demethylspheroidene O-methyltransferase
MTLVHQGPPDALPRPSLIERFRRWRDARLMDPRFQRWAAGFPFTRPVARREARALFDLVSGFVYSQVLAAVVQLKLLELVAPGPLPLETIAARTKLPPDPCRRLVVAAGALRLLEAREGGYGLGQLGAALLGNPGVAAMVEHHALFYDDLADPVALLRGEKAETRLSAYWAYAIAAKPGDLTPDEVASYSRLMGASQAFIAAEILDAWSFAPHRIVMDVGGGEGVFARACAERHPHLRLRVFDLPAVAERARATFRAAGLEARAEAFGGDLFAGNLPEGADCACLIRVLYDHPRERVLAILRAVKAALPAGGTLLVAEPMADAPGAERVGAGYFGLYLLAMKGGAARTPGEIMGLLTEAGFTAPREIATRSPLFTSLVVART